MSKIMDQMQSPPDVFEEFVGKLDDMDRDHHGPMMNRQQELGREREMKRAWHLFKLAVQEAMSK